MEGPMASIGVRIKTTSQEYLHFGDVPTRQQQVEVFLLENNTNAH